MPIQFKFQPNLSQIQICVQAWLNVTHKVSIDEMKAKVNTARIIGTGSTGSLSKLQIHTPHSHTTVHVLSALLRYNQHNGCIHEAQIRCLYVQHIYCYSANENTSALPVKRLSNTSIQPALHQTSVDFSPLIFMNILQKGCTVAE